MDLRSQDPDDVVDSPGIFRPVLKLLGTVALPLIKLLLLLFDLVHELCLGVFERLDADEEIIDQ